MSESEEQRERAALLSDVLDDVGEPPTTLDLLDCLAIAGFKLVPVEGHEMTQAYMDALDARRPA